MVCAMVAHAPACGVATGRVFATVVNSWNYGFRCRIDQACKTIGVYPVLVAAPRWMDLQMYSNLLRRRRSHICRMVMLASGFDDDQGGNLFVARFILRRIEAISSDRSLRFIGNTMDDTSVDSHIVRATRLVAARSSSRPASPPIARPVAPPALAKSAPSPQDAIATVRMP